MVPPLHATRFQAKRLRLAHATAPCSPLTTADLGSSSSVEALGRVAPTDFPPQLLSLLHPDPSWPPLLAPGLTPLGDGLSDAERSSILRALSSSNAESGRRAIVAKFGRFWAFCAQSGVSPIPAATDRILAFIQFLHEEGRVSVRSAPQYVSAITTVHRWFALPDFTATTSLTNGLLAAWRLAVVDEVAHDQVLPFPAASIFTLMDAAADTTNVQVLRSALVVGLDFVFFNRADSAFPITAVDLLIEGTSILFRETRFKRKRAEVLTNRLRRYNAVRFPALLAVLRAYRAARAEFYVDRRPSPYFWQLDEVSRPTSALVRRIFSTAASTWPHLFPAGLTHHALRRGGATSAHAIGIPLETICFWGGWSFGSDAVYKYIDFSHEATPDDFRAFGWMRDKAADIAALFFPHSTL